MGDPAEPTGTGEILAELEVLGREHPEDSERLLAAFRRLWAAPSTPEKVSIIRQVQAGLERLPGTRTRLERNARVTRELEAARQRLAGGYPGDDEAERALEKGEVAALTRQPTSVLETLWDNEADAIHDDP